VRELFKITIAIPEDAIITTYPDAAFFILVQVVYLIYREAMPLIEAVGIRVLCKRPVAKQNENYDPKPPNITRHITA
jgi:hypothetical protein